MASLGLHAAGLALRSCQSSRDREGSPFRAVSGGRGGLRAAGRAALEAAAEGPSCWTSRHLACSHSCGPRLASRPAGLLGCVGGVASSPGPQARRMRRRLAGPAGPGRAGAVMSVGGHRHVQGNGAWPRRRRRRAEARRPSAETACPGAAWRHRRRRTLKPAGSPPRPRRRAGVGSFGEPRPRTPSTLPHLVRGGRPDCSGLRMLPARAGCRAHAAAAACRRFRPVCPPRLVPRSRCPGWRARNTATRASCEQPRAAVSQQHGALRRVPAPGHRRAARAADLRSRRGCGAVDRARSPRLAHLVRALWTLEYTPQHSRDFKVSPSSRLPRASFLLPSRPKD